MASRKTGFQPVAILLTVIAALMRLLPHPPNFTPLGGAALFGGARLRGWQAFVLPLLAMIATDPIRSWVEGGYPAYSWGSLIVYGCFLISVMLGRLFLRDTTSPARIAAVTLAGSVQFFLITNFGVWLGPYYPHTSAGFLACYTAAVPFFGYTVLGDLFYSAVLFGVYAWLKRYSNESEQAPLAA
ncbi:MAG TPA: DUF6580 family putative transport protein [Bryobacteraceae bacterium]|jgi:hypothetical protein|nr:DUF6580 family putative transport protein [Bryobacteraceae bacterium]